MAERPRNRQPLGVLGRLDAHLPRHGRRAGAERRSAAWRDGGVARRPGEPLSAASEANTTGLVRAVSDTGRRDGALDSVGPQDPIGQDYPGRTDDALVPGHVGVLPGLKRNDGFYTNVGVVNLGAATSRWRSPPSIGPASVARPGSSPWTPGAGATVRLLASVGAGRRDLAYATVEVQTPEGRPGVPRRDRRPEREPTTIRVVVSSLTPSPLTPAPRARSGNLRRDSERGAGLLR